MIRKYALAVSLAALCPWTVSAQDVKTVIAGGAKAMGIQDLAAVGSYLYSGSGVSFKLGEAKTPGGPWTKTNVIKYSRVVDFDAAGSWEEITRDGDGSNGAAKTQVETRRITFVEPYGKVGRQFDIWMTPIGFLKSALTHDSTAKTVTVAGKSLTAVSFMTDKKYTITGYFNGQNMLERVETRIDHPVVGDMAVEADYSDYKDFGHGLMFPSKIVEKENGDPVLDLTVTDAVRNAIKYVNELLYSQVNEGAPEYRGPLLGEAPPVFVDQFLYGDRVYYFGSKDKSGEVHHSVLMEFNDYLVVIEAPLDEAHASAVIGEIRKIFGRKPIRYVVSTNAHYTSIGGLRTYAAEGATIITQDANKAYLEKVLNLPHTLNPDKLALAKKKVLIETVAEKRILTDGTHVIELHHIPNAHVDGALIAYLPKEKLLVESELYSAKNPRTDIDTDGHAVPIPQFPDTRYSADLVSSLDRLKLDYETVLCLAGRAAPKAEMLADISKK